MQQMGMAPGQQVISGQVPAVVSTRPLTTAPCPLPEKPHNTLIEYPKRWQTVAQRASDRRLTNLCYMNIYKRISHFNFHLPAPCCMTLNNTESCPSPQSENVECAKMSKARVRRRDGTYNILIEEIRVSFCPVHPGACIIHANGAAAEAAAALATFSLLRRNILTNRNLILKLFSNMAAFSFCLSKWPSKCQRPLAANAVVRH